MPWHDPARIDESAEDRELRSELRELLGLPSDGPFFQAEPTPEMIQLAERLRSEADRRRHTFRPRPAWLLAAAALPFLVAVGALGNWGLQHKRRADQLAAHSAAPAKSTPQPPLRESERGTTPAFTPAETAPEATPRSIDRELPAVAPPAQERLVAMNAQGTEPADGSKKAAADPRRPKGRTRRPGELVIPAEPVSPNTRLPAYQVKDNPR